MQGRRRLAPKVERTMGVNIPWVRIPVAVYTIRRYYTEDFVTFLTESSRRGGSTIIVLSK